MFVRFRESTHRLQVSLVETRRLGGGVRHEHIASLGSIANKPSVADRIHSQAQNKSIRNEEISTPEVRGSAFRD
jgi:hypothetical protein